VPLPVNPILPPQPQITQRLENATKLKRPGHLALLAQEEKPHFHRVPEQPVREHGHPEPLAGTGALVRENLGEGEHGFDGEAGVADCIRVG